MPRLLSKLTACSALLALLSAVAAAPGYAAPRSVKQPGWKLWQRHGSLHGLDIYISSKAIKIDGRDYRWGVLCKVSILGGHLL